MAEIGYMKISPTGDTLAIADTGSLEITLYNFDTQSGTMSYRCHISNVGDLTADKETSGLTYGLEFSENGQLLYYTMSDRSVSPSRFEIYQLPTPLLNAQHSSSLLIGSFENNTANHEGTGALQRAPNGKIYCVRHSESTLAVIQDPDISGLGCNFQAVANDTTGNTLSFSNHGIFGLPNFVTQTIQDSKTCEDVQTLTNEHIQSRYDYLRRRLAPCSEPVAYDWCEPIDLPDFKPLINVNWRENRDGIPTDGCSVMVLTVSNPYSNITISNFMIHGVQIFDEDGNAIPTDSNGYTPLEIVPRGPYCFGDIPPCGYVGREFVLRSHGSEEGEYKIMVEGVCFDVCLHQDTQACLTINVVK